MNPSRTSCAAALLLRAARQMSSQKMVFRTGLHSQVRQPSMLMQQVPTRHFFGRKPQQKEEGKEEAEAKESKDKEEPEVKAEAKEEKKTKEEPAKKQTSSSSSDTEETLSGEDVKKIKALFKEQDAEIESLKKKLLQLDVERAKVAKHEEEMVAFKIEYTKQVRENEATVKRYRLMIEQEKEYAITKFAKDLLEVRDAIRSAVENTNREAVLNETDISVMKEKFEATLEGQQLTADIMDRVLSRFKLE